MSDSLTWDGSVAARTWLRAAIPGAVAQFSEQDQVLMLRTDRGDRHVPYGWVITRAADGTVSVAPGEGADA